MAHNLTKIRQRNRIPDIVAASIGLFLMLAGTKTLIGSPTANTTNIIINLVIVFVVLAVFVFTLVQDRPIRVDTENNTINAAGVITPIENITDIKFDVPVRFSYFIPLIVIEFLDNQGNPIFKLESNAPHSQKGLDVIRHIVDNSGLDIDKKRYYETWLERKSIKYFRLHKKQRDESQKSE